MQTFKNFKNFLKQFPRHWVVTASAWGSRIVSALIQIISIRALLSYLGEERYAVYVIAYSLSGWFALCDVGVGTALQNFISECRARNENYNKYLLAALQLIAAFLLIFIIILLIVSPFIQSGLFSKYVNLPEIQTINIIAVIGCVFIVTALANIVYKVYFALQKGYVSNILPALSMVLSMIIIVIINEYSTVRNSILLALLAFSLPQLLIALFPFFKIFRNFFKEIFNFDSNTIKQLFIRAAKFSGFAVMAAMTLQIDYLIMSQTVDPSGITAYNIFGRFFLVLMFIHSALLAASWPLSNEMFNRGEYAGIKIMLRKYLLFGFAIISLGSFFVYLFSDLIIKILAPETFINTSTIFFILFASYFLLRVLSDTFAMFLQSINAIRVFWIFIPFQALISFAAQLYLSSKYGIHGILGGLIISFILTSCWILPYKTWKVFKSKENLNAI